MFYLEGGGVLHNFLTLSHLYSTSVTRVSWWDKTASRMKFLTTTHKSVTGVEEPPFALEGPPIPWGCPPHPSSLKDSRPSWAWSCTPGNSFCPPCHHSGTLCPCCLLYSNLWWLFLLPLLAGSCSTTNYGKLPRGVLGKILSLAHFCLIILFLKDPSFR